MRVNWIKEADIEGLKVGVVDEQIGLTESYKRKIYFNPEEEQNNE